MQVNYVSEFEKTLAPFLEMLTYQRTQLELKDWEKMVERTLYQICQQPEQYLGKDLPASAVIKKSVGKIFDQFTSSLPKHATV